MCWSHVFRNVDKKIKPLQKINAALSKCILKDITQYQWAANIDKHIEMFDSLEKKYTNDEQNKKYTIEEITSVEEFFVYF